MWSPSCHPGPKAASLYLQTPVQHPRGGTNLSLCPHPGGVSGQGPHTWTCLIRTRRRTRAHLSETKPESVRSQHTAPPCSPQQKTLHCNYPGDTQPEKGVCNNATTQTHLEVSEPQRPGLKDVRTEPLRRPEPHRSFLQGSLT